MFLLSLQCRRHMACRQTAELAAKDAQCVRPDISRANVGLLRTIMSHTKNLLTLQPFYTEGFRTFPLLGIPLVLFFANIEMEIYNTEFRHFMFCNNLFYFIFTIHVAVYL